MRIEDIKARQRRQLDAIVRGQSDPFIRNRAGDAIGVSPPRPWPRSSGPQPGVAVLPRANEQTEESFDAGGRMLARVFWMLLVVVLVAVGVFLWSLR